MSFHSKHSAAKILVHSYRLHPFPNVLSAPKQNRARESSPFDHVLCCPFPLTTRALTKNPEVSPLANRFNPRGFNSLSLSLTFTLSNRSRLSSRLWNLLEASGNFATFLRADFRFLPAHSPAWDGHVRERGPESWLGLFRVLVEKLLAGAGNFVCWHKKRGSGRARASFVWRKPERQHIEVGRSARLLGAILS